MLDALAGGYAGVGGLRLAPEHGQRRLPLNKVAGLPRHGEPRGGGWLAAAFVLAAGCAEGVPETIGREAFIETYVALRVAELTETGGEIISPEERDRVLDEQGVTEEELFGFVEVHGGDVDFMKELWKEVEERMEVLRNPPDTTGGGGEAGGDREASSPYSPRTIRAGTRSVGALPPHSHSIVAGGFELMS